MKSIHRSLGLRKAMLGICLAACLPAAEAALTISNTRVVHSSDARNSSIVVANPSTKVFAVQTWVNTHEDDTNTPVPLIANPSLFRLDPGMEQLVQIQNLPNDLPSDRESLFYFNAQEIPQAEEPGENTLNIAMRTRIKVFYRPIVNVKGTPAATTGIAGVSVYSVRAADSLPNTHISPGTRKTSGSTTLSSLNSNPLRPAKTKSCAGPATAITVITC